MDRTKYTILKSRWTLGELDREVGSGSNSTPATLRKKEIQFEINSWESTLYFTLKWIFLLYVFTTALGAG